MRWFLDRVVKPWHPSILGFVVVVPMGYLIFAGPFESPLVNRWVARHLCEQIEVGMTLEQVERILGLPGERLVLFEKLPPEECRFYMRWMGEQFELYVSFDQHRKATSIAIREMGRQIDPC